jgi:hypothetical protein
MESDRADNQRKPQQLGQTSFKNSIMVFQQDSSLRYTWVYSPTSDFAKDDIIGRSDGEIFVSDDALMLEKIKRYVLTTEHDKREVVELGHTNPPSYYELALRPVRDDVLRVVGISGIMIDVTEFMATNESLREANHRLYEYLARHFGIKM